ncbi:hypothetical protein PQX77_021008 [Marasmius sp. AFHP31]|nr:hypothetical protein PQX77_021008 [Marasmius sp. AFHP31]
MVTYPAQQGPKNYIQGGNNANFGNAIQNFNHGRDLVQNNAGGRIAINNYRGREENSDDEDDEDRPLSPEIFRKELKAFRRQHPLDDNELGRLEGPQKYLDRWQLLIITALPGKLSLDGSKANILDAMVRLSTISGLVPKRLRIKDIGIKIADADADAQPTDAEVYKGKVGTLDVTVKASKGPGPDGEQLKLLSYHALVLQKLDHPNVLPFLGLYYLDESRERLCLVYPWMEKRNIDDIDAGEAKRETWDKVVQGAVDGLNHVHRQEVIHGDLQNSTFLIDSGDVARIADLGLAQLLGMSAGKNEDTDKCQCACVLFEELYGGGVKRSKNGTVPPNQEYTRPPHMTDATWGLLKGWLSKDICSEPRPIAANRGIVIDEVRALIAIQPPFVHEETRKGSEMNQMVVELGLEAFASFP